MLDEIKKDFKWGLKCGGSGQGYTNLDDEQVEWLIQQAEKAERYEKAIEENLKGVDKILIKKIVQEK